MQTLIRALFCLALLCHTGLLLYLSFAPPGTELASFEELPPDAVNHMAANYILALLLLGLLPRCPPLLLAVLLLIAGAGVELLQGRLGRSASAGDLLANVAGIGLALLPVLVISLFQGLSQGPSQGPSQGLAGLRGKDGEKTGRPDGT